MKAALVTIALALATSANAAFMTGNDLLRRLADPESPVSRSIALGYIMGISDAGHGTEHCAPATVTAGQLRDLVHKWLRENPADRHHIGADIIMHILQEAYPCNHGRNSRSGA